jgi:glutamate-1-semialdehyde 2,1-aminomutase
MATETTADRESMLARAAAVLPNGVSSGGRARFGDMVVRARGAHVWNAEGKRFVDYLLGYGPIVVGHCDPRVNDAVARAVATCDLNWVGAQAGEVELAEAICAAMPCADKVAFCTSGDDATLHAVHLARAATGRLRLLKFHGSYHGWHDHVAVGSRFTTGRRDPRAMREPNSAGLHPGCVADVTVVEWNDAEGLRAAFAEQGDELAAAFAEPYVHSYGCVAPAPGFLEELRALCDKHGVVLVFDEVKTGFRHHVGGYQAVCGVTPDLTAFGKALGNGYSIAGIAGRSPIMDLLGSASETNATIEGTYNGSPYLMAAGLATLEILQDGGIERLYELGDRLRAGLSRVVAEADVDACVAGWGSEWAVYFRPDPPRNYNDVLDSDNDRAEAFRRAMFARGILEPPFAASDRRLCLALSDEDIDETVEAAAEALAEVTQPT